MFKNTGKMYILWLILNMGFSENENLCLKQKLNWSQRLLSSDKFYFPLATPTNMVLITIWYHHASTATCVHCLFCLRFSVTLGKCFCLLVDFLLEPSMWRKFMALLITLHRTLAET
jgi:hypothetical protein